MFPSFLKAVNLQPRRAVLDPVLALTPYGVPLATGLGGVMELWVAREFWHILDNIQFYQQHPESLVAADELHKRSPLQTTHSQQMIHALQTWKIARMMLDPVKLNLFWIGDKPSESLLPSDANPELINDWEYLAASLDHYIQQDTIATDALIPVFRDTIALTIGLKSAFILTYQVAEQGVVNPVPPNICKVLQEWGISCQQIDAIDPIAAIERENLLWLMNAAGISKFIWSGLHLAILHLAVPATVTLCSKSYFLSETLPYKLDPTKLNDFWNNTQGFWYWL